MNSFLGKKTKMKPLNIETKDNNNFTKKYPPTITIFQTDICENIKVQLLRNEMGDFVDFRKFYGGRPTKKGIRINLKKFLEAMKNVIKAMKDMHINEEEII